MKNWIGGLARWHILTRQNDVDKDCPKSRCGKKLSPRRSNKISTVERTQILGLCPIINRGRYRWSSSHEDMQGLAAKLSWFPPRGTFAIYRGLPKPQWHAPEGSQRPRGESAVAVELNCVPASYSTTAFPTARLAHRRLYRRLNFGLPDVDGIVALHSRQRRPNPDLVPLSRKNSMGRSRSHFLQRL